MIKSFITFILTLFSLKGISQQKILDYKYSIDSKIKNYFYLGFINKMKCRVISMIGLDSSESFFTNNYIPDKNDKESFLTITFTYSLYSKAIEEYVDFDITISKNKKLLTNLEILEEIPNCIRKNDDCGYIKKDSAIKIAISDSIDFPKNLTAHFFKPLKKNEYYWLITGNKKEINKKNRKRSSVKKISPTQRKIINALTGQIVPKEEYYKLD